MGDDFATFGDRVPNSDEHARVPTSGDAAHDPGPTVTVGSAEAYARPSRRPAGRTKLDPAGLLAGVSNRYRGATPVPANRLVPFGQLQTAASLLPQRDNRVDACGTLRRHVCGTQRDGGQHD
jgi:hypothetical protein